MPKKKVSVEAVTERMPVYVKPPSHYADDWTFFIKHVEDLRLDQEDQKFDEEDQKLDQEDQKLDQEDQKLEIKSYYDLENWKINSNYRLRISHIYDPSHFWVVTKEAELDTFHKYLHEFYTKYKVQYKIPYNCFQVNMYCITYTDKSYYRSILVNVPLAIKGKNLGFAFLIDFGFMAKVSIDNFYFMTTKMYSVPQFAIRGSLAGMAPVDSTKWSTNVVSQFTKMATNKILVGQVIKKNDALKVLFLKISELDWTTQSLHSLHDILVGERLAKKMTLVDARIMKHSEKKKRQKNDRKINLPFLSPTFEEIEKGADLDSVLTKRFLENFGFKKRLKVKK